MTPALQARLEAILDEVRQRHMRSRPIHEFNAREAALEAMSAAVKEFLSAKVSDAEIIAVEKADPDIDWISICDALTAAREAQIKELGL